MFEDESRQSLLLAVEGVTEGVIVCVEFEGTIMDAWQVEDQ